MRLDLFHPWQFQPYSPLHAAVLLAIGGLCVTLVMLGRSRPTLATRLAAALLAIGFISATVYDLLPARRSLANSLPLHVCDVVSIAGLVALVLRPRLARTILYTWGLSLCSFALAMPVVTEGPRFLDFWVYWIWHGAIFAAIAVDAGVNRYRPTLGDVGVAVASLVAYGLVALPVNLLLETNYAYIGNSVGPRSFVALFGPWPGRLAIMLPIAASLMTLSVLPWTLRRRRPIEVAQPADDEPEVVTYRLPLADALLARAA